MLRNSVLILAIVVVVFAATGQSQSNDIVRANVDSSGSQARSGNSVDPSLSESGRYLVFSSAATNLVSGDVTGFEDIFLHDRQSAQTTRMSVTSASAGGNAASTEPFIGADGKYLVFTSKATNLVSGDVGEFADIFLYDTTQPVGTFTKISLDSGAENSDGDSASPAVSEDGRFVVFASDARDLVAGDGNGKTDIFLYDSQLVSVTNRIIRISVNSSDVEGNGNSTAPIISADGKYVAFQSDATNLVAADTNQKTDIFLYSREADTLIRISTNSVAVEGNGASTAPKISEDGRYTVFQSDATNLIDSDANGKSDIFLYDRQTPAISRVSLNSSGLETNGQSFAPAISLDGLFVGYLSDATNIVSGDTNNTAGDGVLDAFVYSRSGGTSTRENVTLAGTQTSGAVSSIVVDGDGSVAAFTSDSDELVTSDTNEFIDIFVTDTSCPTDSDSDSTNNCSDGCPTDATKTSAGACGCSIAETDTDGDSTPDCNDSCDSDASKIVEGDCGCGVADTDLNENGASDCLDPTSSTVPRKPRVTKSGSSKFVVRGRRDFLGVTYEFIIKRNGSQVARKVTTNRIITLRNLQSGNYSVKYRVLLGEVTSKFSKKVSLRL